MANAFKAVINGPGQLLYGLSWNPDTGYSISGAGLSTLGFLWLKNDIWQNCDPPVELDWEECECNPNCL